MSAVGWADPEGSRYRAYYGSRFPAYERRDHLERKTHAREDYPRYRCVECGAAITVNPVADVEYGHHRRSTSSWSGGRCPHRPSEVDATPICSSVSHGPDGRFVSND